VSLPLPSFSDRQALPEETFWSVAFIEGGSGTFFEIQLDFAPPNFLQIHATNFMGPIQISVEITAVSIKTVPVSTPAASSSIGELKSQYED